MANYRVIIRGRRGGLSQMTVKNVPSAGDAEEVVRKCIRPGEGVHDVCVIDEHADKSDIPVIYLYSMEWLDLYGKR